MPAMKSILALAVFLFEQVALAQPTEPLPEPAPAPAPTPAASTPEPPEPEPEPAPMIELPRFDLHGFVSQGGFLSTTNDYLGNSTRGSLELTEAGLNVSTEPADRLRVGLQLFTRDLGPIGNYDINLDWAYLDYRWRQWLGLRAGRIKMPFGLYNEYADIDASRLWILLPQSLYPTTSRDVLLAQTGFSIYGSRSLGRAGSLDYQLLFGTIYIDPADSPQTKSIDTKYTAGGQLFWQTPLEGLRVGGSVLRCDFRFIQQLDQATIDALVAAGAVPPDFDGQAEYRLDPVVLWVASTEYVRDDWTFAAEYSRWYIRVETVPAALFPANDSTSERFYAALSRRLAERAEAGAYYSVKFADVDDRSGDGPMFMPSHRAFQKDLAATVRYDLTDTWLWKLEAHFMDGTADLRRPENPDPDRYWGFFLVKTTVSF